MRLGKTYVLIDLSYLAYRAMYTMKNLAHDDVPTGVLFGFFNQLYTICTSPYVNSHEIHVCIDSRASFRRDVYPEYKGQRKKDLDEDDKERWQSFFDQINELSRVILPAIGIPTYEQDGLESDDLLAWLARRIHCNALLSSQDHRAIIVTGDHDLYQCITNHVDCHDSQRKMILNQLAFEIKYGIKPWQFAHVKAIGGCTSDNVKGIPGIGEKSAIAYLLGDLKPKSKKYQSITSAAGQRVYARNLGLVTLPHAKTKPFKIKSQEVNMEQFEAMCQEKGLLTMLNNMTKWRRFFKGKLNLQPVRRRGFLG